MSIFEFIEKYPAYFQELREHVKEELLPVLTMMEKIKPEELLTYQTGFSSESQARGLVWSIFLKLSKVYRAEVMK